MLRKGDTVVFNQKFGDSDFWGKVGVLVRDQMGDGSNTVLVNGENQYPFENQVYKLAVKPDNDRDTIDNFITSHGGYHDKQAWERLVARLTPLTD